MKKNIITITVLTLLVILTSCSKEGEIKNKSEHHILLNGKEYYFIKVVPADGEYGVWLLLPKDTKVEIPQVISYNLMQPCGKGCNKKVTLTAIMIRS